MSDQTAEEQDTARAALAGAQRALGGLLCVGLPQFTSDALEDVLDAMEWCSECPAAELCREAGRTERAGVWGGVPRDPDYEALAATVAELGVSRAVAAARAAGAPAAA